MKEKQYYLVLNEEHAGMVQSIIMNHFFVCLDSDVASLANTINDQLRAQMNIKSK